MGEGEGGSRGKEYRPEGEALIPLMEAFSGPCTALMKVQCAVRMSVIMSTLQ